MDKVHSTDLQLRRGRKRVSARAPMHWVAYLRALPAILRGIKNWYALGLLPLKPVELRLRSGQRFGVHDLLEAWVLIEVLLLGEYEQCGVRIPERGVVVDIGAGIGDFCIGVASRSPSVQVYAFEASPQTFERLAAHLTRNRVSNVIASPKAVTGLRSETVAFRSGASSVLSCTSTTDSMDDGIAGQPRGMAASEVGASEMTAREVAAIPLEEVFSNISQEPELVKIDCEGGEYDIILESSDLVLRRAREYVIEWHEVPRVELNVAALVRKLQAAGFKVRHKPRDASFDCGLLFAERVGPASI